jgi:soluble lytic murein transglycosylase-like protein
MCLAAALLGLVLAGTGTADIYAIRNPDGTVSFTDVPTGPGYSLIIRTDPPPQPAWREVVHRESERFGLDPQLIRAVIRVESNEDPKAISSKGAQGLMQLMPDTARELGVRDAFRPHENVRGGITYLASLIERFRGRLDLALAAYNAGPGAVERHGGIPPYPETQEFVRKVLDIYSRLGRKGG